MYLALMDSHKIFAANKNIRKSQKNNRYGKLTELNSEKIVTGIIKKVEKKVEGKVVQFEMERQSITYDVKVDYNGSDYDKLQVTAINQQNPQD